MKRFWPRILAAFSTLAIGLFAASVARLLPVPAVKLVPPRVTVEVKALPQPPPVIETPQPPPPPEETTRLPEKTVRPHSVSISPYEIKRLVDEDSRAARGHQDGGLELESIWKRLNIGSRESTNTPCDGYCDASIQAVELDGKPGGEVLLTLCADHTLECRYLVFKPAGARRRAGPIWTLLGYAEADIWWSDRPSHRVMSDGPRQWLAIKHVSGHGSGFGSDAEDWYEVTDGGVARVFSYQTGLYCGFCNPAVDRETKVQEVASQSGVTRVVLQSSTSYGARESGISELAHLWSSQRRATFIRDQGTQQFVFDLLHSELPGEELDPSFEGDPVTNTGFLKYNYREAVRIAAKGNAKQREWLRRYLETCDEGALKQSLLRVLRGEQP